jgi:hypothetical protein
MFGWIAVHVQANKVAPQVHIIPQRVLVLLLDGQSLMSNVWILVPLRIGNDAWTIVT